MEYLEEILEDYSPMEEVKEIVEAIKEKLGISYKKRQSTLKEPCHIICPCTESNYRGRPCECMIIIEDIRTLLAIQEFIDSIIAGQQQALKVPMKHSKPYDMIELAFQYKCLKFTQPKFKSEEDKFKKSQKLHVILMRRNLKLEAILKNRKQNSIYTHPVDFIEQDQTSDLDVITERIEEHNSLTQELLSIVEEVHKRMNDSEEGINGSLHSMNRRYSILKAIKEEDAPSSCLADRKKLLEHIGEHRILPKELENMFMVEEINKKIVELMKKTSASNKEKKKATSAMKKKHSAFSNEEKMKTKRYTVQKKILRCNCNKINTKIEILENFKNMVANLQNIFNNNLIQRHRDLFQDMKEKHEASEEGRMTEAFITELEEYKIIILDEQLKSHTESKSDSSSCEDVKKEKEIIEELIKNLKNYFNMDKTKLTYYEEKIILSNINKLLENYLQEQEEYFNGIEKSSPCFKEALYSDQFQKEEIVRKICKDERKNYQLGETREEVDDVGWGKLRHLLKMFTRKINIIDKVKKYKTEIDSKLNGDTSKSQKNKIDLPSNKTGEETISKSEKNRSPNEAECNTMSEYIQSRDAGIILEMFFHKKRVSQGKNKKSLLEKICYSDSDELKNLVKAYMYGRKLLCQPDTLTTTMPEKAIFRQRLLHELELKKGMKEAKCDFKRKQEIRKELQRAYEVERSDECKCVSGAKKLQNLKNEVEKIILDPEAFNIWFVGGPITPYKTLARKKMDKILAELDSEKEKPEHVHSLHDEISKRSLATIYDENRFKFVWGECDWKGMFTINHEAQMMENERILICPQYEKRVKVMSGGKMGLEPLYNEYVCTGMLDCAVLGSKKDGPIPRTILQGILEVDSGQGVVIIILNEPEIRLNFLFGIERARKLGVEVELVLARDDISEQQPEEWRYGRQGHSGLFLQYKIAAGMAVKGHNLATISRVTQNIQMATIGCQIRNDETFIGTGISIRRGQFMPGTEADEILYEMLGCLLDPDYHWSIGPEPDANMIILLNNSEQRTDDIYSTINIIAKQLIHRQSKVVRVYHGSFSYFPFRGFSITLAKDWNNELIPYLDMPTTCIHWPPHSSGMGDNFILGTKVYKKRPVGACVSPEIIPIIFDIIDKILKDTITSTKKVTIFNPTTGDQILETVLTIRLELNLGVLPLSRPLLLLRFLGKTLRKNLGFLGKLLQIAILGAAQEFLRDDDFVLGWKNWCMALLRGTQALMGYTKFKVGQETIIDYLVPVSENLSKIEEGWSPLTFFYGGLHKVKDVVEKRNDDPGIILLDCIFKNIYECLFKHMGHFRGDQWWKEKEQCEYSFASTDAEKLSIPSNPSIEAVSLEESYDSLLSAAGYAFPLKVEEEVMPESVDDDE